MIRERNCSIDIFRYIAALLIVELHTTPLIDINPMASYLFAQVLPRVGVPFFFIVAGYFYMTKLENGTADPVKYICHLLLPYVIWSLIYFAAYFIENGSISFGFILSRFFLYGSSNHFWLFPSLIYCVLLASAVYRLKLKSLLIPGSLILFAVGCMGNAYYEVFKGMPLIAAMMGSEKYLWYTHFFCLGPAFFVAGYVLLKSIHCWEHLGKKRTTLYLAGACCLYLVEVFLLKVTATDKTITVTPSLYILVYFLLLWLLKHPCPQMKTWAEFCRKMSNYTYYSHMLFITIISTAYMRLWGEKIGETKVFLCVVVCTFVTGVFLIHRKSKLTKMLIG